MTTPKRHLHRDYHTSECGKDASHIPMTYDEAEANCAACAKGKVKRLADEAEAEAARQAEIAAEAQRQDQESAERTAQLEALAGARGEERQNQIAHLDHLRSMSATGPKLRPPGRSAGKA